VGENTQYFHNKPLSTMKKNEFNFFLTINNEEVDYLTKATSYENEMHLSIDQLAVLLNIDSEECINRIGTLNGKIGVFPGSITDSDDRFLTQCLEESDGYTLVYTWETFSKIFPEAENVDWEAAYASYLKARDKDTSAWRNEKSLFILCGDGRKDKERYKCIFDENSIIISWVDFLKKFEYTREQVVNSSMYNKYLPEQYSHTRSAIRDNFVEDLRVRVVPDNTPLSQINFHDKEFLVVTWSDFLIFFKEAVYVKWDEPDMPIRKINSI
jgi:hypothetical protein